MSEEQALKEVSNLRSYLKAGHHQNDPYVHSLVDQGFRFILGNFIDVVERALARCKTVDPNEPCSKLNIQLVDSRRERLAKLLKMKFEVLDRVFGVHC